MFPWLKRYLQLLTGTGVAALHRQGAPVGRELLKSIMTGAGTAGAGLGAMEAYRHGDEIADFIQSGIDNSNSRIGKILKSLNVKVGQANDSIRRDYAAQLAAFIGSGIPYEAGAAIRHLVPEMGYRPQLVRRLLRLAREHHKGLMHGEDYMFDTVSRKIIAPRGLKGDVGAIAHEIGHAKDPILSIGRGVPTITSNWLRNAGAIGGVWGAVGMPDRESAQLAALLGTSAAVPSLAHEVSATVRGMRLLRTASKQIPATMLIRSALGLPSYIGAAAAPFTAYSIRKELGGFKDRNNLA